MATTLTKDVLSLLIHVGNSAEPESRELESMCAPLRDRSRCAALHWSEWDKVCAVLSLDDHVALLKGLTMAERYAGWSAGSVSPIIWVYRNLEPRVPVTAAQELARWVMERSDNPYAPFGSTVLANHFDPSEDLRHHRGRLSDLLSARRLTSHLARSAEHERRTEAAKAERLERQARESQAHQGRKAQRDGSRNAMVAEGMALGTADRLRLVVEREDLPLLAFPAEWAEEGVEAVSSLPEEVKQRLRGRLSGMNRGPWSRLAAVLKLATESKPG